jgi:hypothetical protein
MTLTKTMRHRFFAGLAAGLAVCGAAGAGRAQTVEWTRQLGTSSEDRSHGVSADGLGNVYISGFTFGSLGGPHAGSGDAFVAKLVPVPEPTGVALALAAAVGVLALRRKTIRG